MSSNDRINSGSAERIKARAPSGVSALTIATRFITRPLMLVVLIAAAGASLALAFGIRQRRRARAGGGGLEAA